MTNEYLNKIHLGNSIELANAMPAESIDMIFADPPYNLQIKHNLYRPDMSRVVGVVEEWDKFDDFQQYDQFTTEWVTAMRRILKPNGTIWVIGSYHNIFRVGSAIQNLGYWILNDVVWVKHNPMPNFRGTRFTNAHETLIWAAKTANSKYCFNYDAMKAMNDDSQMRSDWHLSLCSGFERLKNADGITAHPTQKPESLLYRVILASTNVGDVVFDPFSGTGTTAAMAKRMGRHFIGCEMDKNYYELSVARLNAIKEPTNELELEYTKPKRKEARVPFGRLLEMGMVKPGEQLLSPCQKFQARVLADGSIKTDFYSGSIHRVAAQILGTESCNGWMYWALMRPKGVRIPINNLREEIRKNA